MKLVELLKVPIMENAAVGGVLDTIVLNDVDVDYFCDKLGIPSDKTLEEKRDAVLDVIEKADPLNEGFSKDTYEFLCSLANNYEAPEEDEEEELDYISNLR